MAKRSGITRGFFGSGNTVHYEGDTRLGSIPSGRTVVVENGTLTINGVVGEDVKVIQRGAGNVVVNARTHWNTEIQAEGNVSVVSTAYKTKIRAGGDIHVKYTAHNGSDLEAKGKVRIGGEAKQDVRVKGQTVDIGDRLHDHVTIIETGAGRQSHHTLSINGLMGKHVKIHQQGNGDVVTAAATNHFADIRSDGDISVVAAVYKTKLHAGRDIHVKQDVYNQAELTAKRHVHIGGDIHENVTIRSQKVIGSGHIGANTKLIGPVSAPKPEVSQPDVPQTTTPQTNTPRSFAERVQEQGNASDITR